MKANEYTWHCPKIGCGSIIHKTKQPFISDGEFRCKRCNCFFNAEQLMAFNICNLKNYIKRIDIVVGVSLTDD